MTKLNWNRQNRISALNSEYWTDPKKGFDKAWHEQQKHNQAQATKDKQFLGEHAEHQLEQIQLQSGPHSGKLICKTCDKFLKWLPKEAFN